MLNPVQNNRNLDVLRAFAVLAVLFAHSTFFLAPSIYHARPVWGLGRFGVLLFFVHTALVLMLSLERTAARPRWIARFYVQRAFRIYPLAVLVVLATLAFRIPAFFDAPYKAPPLRTVIANLGLFQNLTGETLSNVMWSLPFEVQMYCALPFVFLFMRRFGIAVSLALAFLVPIGELALPFNFGLTQFVPCFMGGVLAFALRDRKPRLAAALWPALVAIVAFFFVRSGMSPLNQWAVCPVIGAAIYFFRDAHENILTKGAAIIARYSYGIYLCHVPAGWLCFQKLHGGGLLYLATVAAMSAAAYHFCEAPMMRFGRRISAGLERVGVTARADFRPGIRRVAEIKVS